MGHLVRNAPEHKTLHPRHAPVPHHDEIGVNSLGDADQGVSWITVGIVHFGSHSLTFCLGEELRTDAVSVVPQVCTGGLRRSRDVGESCGGDGMNCMNGMHLGAGYLCQGKGLSDSNSSSV